MDLATYRDSALEQQRIQNLCDLLPRDAHTVLDAGARDGYISLRLAKTFDAVTALDLCKPPIHHPKIQAVQGDITRLSYADRVFDMVLCTEVLEHLPTPLLRMACRELRRVSQRYILVGVPYKQDLRVGRTTCVSCEQINPPWSHLHSFNEQRLRALFPGMEIESIALVGSHRERTNKLSTLLLDWAGNPYGTYTQEESCVHCGQKLQPPRQRSFMQKVITKIAVTLNRVQSLAVQPQANWIHVLFRHPIRHPIKASYPNAATSRDYSAPRPTVTRLSA